MCRAPGQDSVEGAVSEAGQAGERRAEHLCSIQLGALCITPFHALVRF